MRPHRKSLRIAIIADIHANLEALQAVLERIHALNVDEIVCLGDIVGYNGNPNECADILRRDKILSVLGNHDACAAGLEEPYRFNALARSALLWTREQLTEENRSFLLELPREKRVHDCILFHGSIHDTNRYILSRDDVEQNFQSLAGLPGALHFGFFGHTHIRMALCDNQGSVLMRKALELALSPDKRYLINPGSVGQPRDGDPRAAFLVYDATDHVVFFHRVEYVIRRCQDKIIRAGLPPQLAERLEKGW